MNKGDLIFLAPAYRRTRVSLVLTFRHLFVRVESDASHCLVGIFRDSFVAPRLVQLSRLALSSTRHLVALYNATRCVSLELSENNSFV